MRLFYLIILLTPCILFAQKKPETYNIKYPKKKKKCSKYISLYRSLPIDLRYDVRVIDNTIYFMFPNEKYFKLIFNKKTDGIAIDIIRRNQYKCNAKNSFNKSWACKGFLMPPMYKSDMIKNLQITREGYVFVKYGEIPKGFNRSNIECNLVVLQKKYLCSNHAFLGIKYTNWELLEMGMFQDSLSADEFDKVHKQISKTLHFKIPFQKNKVKFNTSDIKPLYDSLNITDYNIQKITIKAYTSVEGSLERNINLQNNRAKSIVKALQSYQKPEILTSISSNENWVEFINDIKNTEFSYLLKLSKSEIKSELTKTSIREKIEPLLKNHRKAIVKLKLQKKFTTEENNPKLLKKFFDQNIASKNIDEAIYIQNIIFEKIRNQQLPQEFINKLEVPKESSYGPLLNNLAIFSYEINDEFLYENILNFERLLEIIPNNVKIMYNLTALKIKAWSQGELATNQNDIKKLIEKLEKNGIDKSLVRRLKVNYYIILTEYYQLKKNYKKKNKYLKEVYWLYSKLDLNDKDLLSLSRYLARYSKFDWAEAVIKKRIGDINIEEALIFYYIRLTIKNAYKTRQMSYRKTLLNAINKNNRRFCDLFLPISRGGYSFQLLNNKYVKKVYCENCNN